MLQLLRISAFCLLLTAAVAPSSGRSRNPARQPAAWNVEIRYRIFAFRSERIRQYREMLAAFELAGFERDPDEDVSPDEPDNPRATRMRGTVPARGVPKLLAQRHVQALLISPRGAKMPAKGSRVRVEMTLSSGFAPGSQRDLHEQTARGLAKAARFVEAVGYDHRGFTRLLGSVPVDNLKGLLDGTPRKARGKRV